MSPSARPTSGASGASSKEAAAAADPARALAHILRGAKGPEARSARLEDNMSRVDYFRGKDLYRTMIRLPEVLDEYAPKLTGVPTPTAPSDADRVKQVTAIGRAMLRHGYVVRCDRVYKQPRPGRTRRVKFPKFLHAEPKAKQQFTEDGEGFYAWQIEQPMSWAFVIVSFLVAFAVILMCLFPLSPVWFKKAILYTCLSILGTFFVIFVVRAIVFAIVWIVFGRHFWILPNISSDEIPIDEIFSPMYAFDDLDPRTGEVVGQIPTLKRLLAAGTAGLMLAGLYRIAPEKGSAIKSINRAHGSILDLFDLYDTPKSIGGEAASGGETPPAAAADAGADDPGAGAAAGAATGGGGGGGGLEADVGGAEADVGEAAPAAPPPPYEGGEDADAGAKTEL